MNFFLRCSIILLIYPLTSHVLAAPVDLSSWQVNGNGSWSLNSTNAPNDSANQTSNSIPTVLFNGQNSQDTVLTGTITVQTTTDDDFIGFVLGYDDNDLSGANATTDYILVDWKQSTQSNWDAGMTISRVTGGPIASSGTDTGGDAWTHTGNVNLIQRATTLGNTGWADNTEYVFNITFTATNIQVSVDGVQQFNINGTFKDGSFGFYNFSQPNVRYAGITEVIVVPNQAPNGIIETPASNIEITVGQSVNFTAAGSDPDNNQPLQYLWTFGAGSDVTDSTVEDPGNIPFNRAGVFTVVFTVTDSLGLTDPSPSAITVTVNAPSLIPPTPVPTLSEWSIIILILILFLVGFRGVRRI